MAVVGANAAEAASGAAASQASIPVIGPLLAAAAFASIMALVLGSRSTIKSAAGGYDIPGNINPLVQAHASEMILPARYADVIRGMASNGDGGGADTMAQSTIHIHGSPDDSIKLRDLAAVLKRMHRNFEFV